MTWIVIVCVMMVLFIFIVFFTCYYHHNREDFINNVETHNGFPRIIWTFWHSNDLPLLVRLCIKTWKKLCPNYKITVVNLENINSYLSKSEFDYKELVHNDMYQRLSDYVRVNLLAKYGGVWMDATIILNKDLDDWLYDGLRLTTDFIGYYLSGNTTNPNFPVIDNWFFACKPTSKFMKLWRDEFMRTNDYNTIRQYVYNVKYEQNVDLQNFKNYQYLTMHVAAQCVLQKQMTSDEISSQLILMKGERGPFKVYFDNSWNNRKVMEALCTTKTYKEIPFIKFMGSQRHFLDRNPKYLTCLFDYEDIK